MLVGTRKTERKRSIWVRRFYTIENEPFPNCEPRKIIGCAGVSPFHMFRRAAALTGS